ncbi:ATP-dependent helicase, partial [Dermatophilus congolensis]
AITITNTNGRPAWHPNTTCHTILWAIWNATNAAPLWCDTALNGTTASARADRDLDAVVALFAAADAYTTRLPGSGPLSFLEHLLSQDVAADTLAARGQRGRQVTLTTPAGAVGREWGLVIIAGLQEGVWPDTRLRGSLLGSERLVDILTNRGTNIHAQLIDVLHDEARLFALATSRARQRLIITATSNEDEQPSNYCELVRQATPNNHPEQCP